MSSSLHIGLLGEFKLTSDGEPITSVTAPRLQSLVAYLALHRSAPQSRAHIAYLFWPDSTEKQALTNLRHLLHRLRKAFPESERLIGADAQTLCWRLGPTLDIEEFDRALANADTARVQKEPSTKLEHLLHASDIYRGDLLPSCYDEWIEGDRTRLRQDYAQALEALIRLLESRRDYASAIRFANRLQQHEPLREPTYRTLIRLHALADDRAGVIDAYEACREMLEREFDAAPADATEKLHRRLLDPQNVVTIPHAGGAGSGEYPLVGRFREWERLKNAWRRSKEDGSRLVVVTGEAGIGKTRLVEELLTWVRRQGVPAARSRSYAAEGRLAYAPIADWLRSDALRSGLDELEHIWLTEIARILPEIRIDNPELPTVASAREEWDRRRLFDALTRAFTAREGPQVLALDDLQWTDQPTLEWLRYLLSHAPEARLLVAATIRIEEVETELESLLFDLRIDGRLEEIALGALNLGETASIARHTAGRDLDDEEAARLQEETEGNPLFVVEMLRMRIQEDGGAQTRHAAVDAVIHRPKNGSNLPPKVHAVISRRLRRLSSPAVEVAGLAAVLGRAFTAEMLAEAGRQTSEEVASALDELWRRRVITEESVGRYDFTHDKLREVAYEELSPERRRLLHLRAAQALQSGAREDDSTTVHVAAHFEQAGHFEQAANYYRKAADAARQVYAGTEAARLYRRALDLISTLPEAYERTRLELAIQTALGACLVANEGYPAPEVRRAYERARTLCEELGTPVDPPILRGMALSNISGGDLDEARRIGEALLGHAESEGDPVLAVEGEYVLGVTAFWQGRLTSSRKHLENALDEYDPERRSIHTSLYAQDPKLICGVRLALTLWYLGYGARALKMGQASIEEARQLGHPQTSAYVLAFGTHLFLDAHEAERAASQSRELLDLADRYEFSTWRELGKILHGWAMAERGRLEDGVALMRETMGPYRNLGSMLQMPQFLAVLGDLFRRMGELEKARSMLHESFDLLERRGERYYEAELYRLKAELLLEASPDSAEGEAALRKSLAIADADGARFLQVRSALSLARLRRRQQRIDDARRLLRRACEMLPDGFETQALRQARSLLEALA